MMAFKLIVIVLASYLHVIDAFSPRHQIEIAQPSRFSVGAPLCCRRRQAPPSSSLAAESATTVDEAVDQASLVLRADYVGESSSAPATSQEAMLEFFSDPKHSTCLITAGNKRESHTVPVTDELLSKWKKRGSILGAEEPNEGDVIISVRTGGIKFPGVTVESTSLIGSTLLLPTDSNPFPSYEFVLIQDQREATGLKPIVWVYNQLVHPERAKDASPMSLSRVAPYPTEDGKSITFKIHSFLEINVKFPAVLLKILPMSKEKAEAKGADAVLKVLKNDIDVSIEQFRDIYVESLQSS